MSEQPMQQRYVEDDAISLKYLILKFKEFWNELWRYWWIILLFVIPIALFMVYSAISTPKTYPAKLTFMVNDDEGGGGLGGAASVLSSFGIGGSGGGDYNLEKMLELVRSRKLMQTFLFKKQKIEGKEDYYSNHLIDLYDYHEVWLEDTTGLRDFKFTHDSIGGFTRTENSVLKQLHGKMIGNVANGIKGLLGSSISENTSIMTLTLNTESEALSILMLEDVFEELSDYYVEKSIEKQKFTYDAMKFKTDSIYKELRSAEYGLANYKDTNRGLYTAKKQLKTGQLTAKIQMLYTMYGEAIKNLEMAEFGLRDKTPVVQVIDLPIPPIRPVGDSLIKNLIIACLLGGLLGAGFIIVRKIIRDAMET